MLHLSPGFSSKLLIPILWVLRLTLLYLRTLIFSFFSIKSCWQYVSLKSLGSFLERSLTTCTMHESIILECLLWNLSLWGKLAIYLSFSSVSLCMMGNSFVEILVTECNRASPTSGYSLLVHVKYFIVCCGSSSSSGYLLHWYKMFAQLLFCQALLCIQQVFISMPKHIIIF